MTQTITLTGYSGTKYEYSLADVNNSWLKVPGNYAFVDGDGWPKYIGQTEDFSSRRPGPDHDKWSEAAGLGATHVIAHANHGGEMSRKVEEADLIRAYDPPANVQHRPTAGLLRRPGFGLGG